MQRRRAIALFGVAAASLLGLPSARADLSITLGDRDFLDGEFPSGSQVTLASFDDPAPFDGPSGSDKSESAFEATWTFEFEPSFTIDSASVRIGISDHDSATTGSQLALFEMDGVDLTSELDLLFETRGGRQLEYNIYTVDLSPSAIHQLVDGSATFTIELAGPNLSSEPSFDLLPGNAAALDFSTLTLVPAPGAVAPLLLLGFGARHRRR
ncbi:MAG: hypothetical protein AAGB51_11480 [Planctomycetota bacterium]